MLGVQVVHVLASGKGGMLSVDAYSKVPNKRRRRLLIFTFFSSVDALIPVSTIIKFHLDSLKIL